MSLYELKLNNRVQNYQNIMKKAQKKGDADLEFMALQALCEADYRTTLEIIDEIGPIAYSAAYKIDNLLSPLMQSQVLAYKDGDLIYNKMIAGEFSFKFSESKQLLWTAAGMSGNIPDKIQVIEEYYEQSIKKLKN